jgi:anti-sigma regulatory factor (Ser/Thr protein kinase)
MVHQDLPSATTSPLIARAFVLEALADCPESVVTKAELLTSELVTNAVTHGAPPIHLAVRVDPGLVTVSVTDGSSEPPIMRDVQTTDSHGRGLRIVEALASQWGHTGHHVGKTVWCSLRY